VRRNCRGMDPGGDLWPICQAILNSQDMWQDSHRPIIIPESDTRLSQCEETKGKSEDWRMMAKSIAITGCRRVLEDGPEVCTSESAERREHREEHSDSDMYTADIKVITSMSLNLLEHFRHKCPGPSPPKLYQASCPS
jgi:hypothetical protein